MAGADLSIGICPLSSKDPQEATSLIKELLIGVTSFFRETEAFESLKKIGLPKLVENKPEGYTFRAWVAGCARGEEAYTLGIIFREYLDEHRPDMTIRIFATDLDEVAVHRDMERVTERE